MKYKQINGYHFEIDSKGRYKLMFGKNYIFSISSSSTQVSIRLKKYILTCLNKRKGHEYIELNLDNVNEILEVILRFHHPTTRTYYISLDGARNKILI